MSILSKWKSRWNHFRQFEYNQRALNTRIRPLLSLELGAYTYEDCLLSVASTTISHEAIGVAAQMLYCRCNRGKGTLEDAIDLLNCGGINRNNMFGRATMDYWTSRCSALELRLRQYEEEIRRLGRMVPLSQESIDLHNKKVAELQKGEVEL